MAVKNRYLTKILLDSTVRCHISKSTTYLYETLEENVFGNLSLVEH